MLTGISGSKQVLRRSQTWSMEKGPSGASVDEEGVCSSSNKVLASSPRAPAC